MQTLPFSKQALLQIQIGKSYCALHEYAKTEQVLQPLLRSLEHFPVDTQAHVHANLAEAFYRNRRYAEAVKQANMGLRKFAEGQITCFDAQLYHLLGACSARLGRFAEAKRYLEKSETIALHTHIDNLTELTLMAMATGEHKAALQYLAQAIETILQGTSEHSYSAFGRLCQAAGQFVYGIGQDDLAARLADNAQVLFGDLGAWQEWATAEQARSAWSRWDHHIRQQLTFQEITSLLHQLQRFLQLLNIRNGQELLDTNFRHWFDVRVAVARQLCKQLRIDATEQRALIYACRLADFGLTALEKDVVDNPHRSAVAWAQYCQHPWLGVQMLTWMDFSTTTYTVIEQHHERFDGKGFPMGYKASQIHPLARMIAVADDYAYRVTVANQTHSAAKQAIEREAGHAFDPSVVTAFSKMFAPA